MITLEIFFSKVEIDNINFKLYSIYKYLSLFWFKFIFNKLLLHLFRHCKNKLVNVYVAVLVLYFLIALIWSFSPCTSRGNCIYIIYNFFVFLEMSVSHQTL